LTEPSLSVVIPAYNEEGRLPATLARVSAYLAERQATRGESYEILVVVNGSTDRTAEVATAAARRDPNLQVILTPLRGKGRAVKIGATASRGARILFCDADLSTPIEEAVALADLLGTEYGLVIATREGKGSRRVGEPYLRHLMGRVFNLVVRTLAVPGIQDTQCGCKAFTRACAGVVFGRQTIDGFGFDVELLYVARKHGYRIRQVPITWVYAPSSRVDPVRDSFLMFADVLRVRLNDLLGKYA
jgi:dolichyl-phosphate beta-glucosyltransferase